MGLRTVRHLSVAVVVVALCATSGASAAVTENDEPPPTDVISHTDQLQLDAATLSASTDMSRDTAGIRVAHQEDVAKLIAEVRDVAQGKVSGVFADIETGVVTVRLVGAEGGLREVDKALADLEVRVPESYEFKIVSDGIYTEVEFGAEATRISAQLGRHGVSHHGVEYDPRAGEIVVLADAHLPQSPWENLTEYPLRVETETGETGPTRRGGVNLSTCTAAFSVRIPAGYRGFLTAGHCGNSQAYALTPTGTASYSSTYVAGLNSPNADLQWHRISSHTPLSEFYGGSASTPTTLSGTGTAYVGQSLCHRGRATGYSCGEVTSVTYAPPASWSVCGGQACAANWVRVSGIGLANLHGDSGGPWFSGGYAYGVHSGGLIAEVGAWAAYTPISRISSLGIVLE